MGDLCPTWSAADPDATAAVAALVARIGGSQIVARTSEPANWAPPGYDATDIRVLEWIGSHRRDRRAAAELAA